MKKILTSIVFILITHSFSRKTKNLHSPHTPTVSRVYRQMPWNSNPSLLYTPTSFQCRICPRFTHCFLPPKLYLNGFTLLPALMIMMMMMRGPSSSAQFKFTFAPTMLYVVFLSAHFLKSGTDGTPKVKGCVALVKCRKRKTYMATV